MEFREHWAFLAAIITNGFSGLAASMSSKRRKPKWIKAEDFVDKDFHMLFERLFSQPKKKKKDSLEKLVTDAKAKGLEGPWLKAGEVK